MDRLEIACLRATESHPSTETVNTALMDALKGEFLGSKLVGCLKTFGILSNLI